MSRMKKPVLGAKRDMEIQLKLNLGRDKSDMSVRESFYSLGEK